MLQYINEGNISPKTTKIVLHYLVRSRESALFLEMLRMIKNNFGNVFDAHIWITRKELEKSFMHDDRLTFHRGVTYIPDEEGQPWEWWNSFAGCAMEHFRVNENIKHSLVYICGPQGLTDRLLLMYERHGFCIDGDHLQVEKWW